MNFRFRLVSIVMVLILTSLACSMGGGSDATQPAGSENVLFQDDFSKSSSGWDRIQSEDGITDYEDGSYRIFVPDTDTELWANPGLDFSDVQIEVDATLESGPEDNDFGVICRYQDIDNFYYFIVTSDGYYGILKVKDGDTELFGGEEMGTTDAVKAGNAANHVRADCVGSTLTLYVNGEQLDSQTDADFVSGDVGLIAGTYGEPDVNILFDNFTVLKP